MKVFDDAVVFAGDVDVEVGEVFDFATGKAGEGDDGEAVFFRPFAGAEEVGGVAGARNSNGDVAFGGVGRERKAENFFVVDIVADGGGQADVIDEADGVEAFFAFDAGGFDEVGDEVARGVGAATIAEGEDVAVVAPGGKDHVGTTFERGGI